MFGDVEQFRRFSAETSWGVLGGVLLGVVVGNKRLVWLERASAATAGSDLRCGGFGFGFVAGSRIEVGRLAVYILGRRSKVEWIALLGIR